MIEQKKVFSVSGNGGNPAFEVEVDSKFACLNESRSWCISTWIFAGVPIVLAIASVIVAALRAFVSHSMQATLSAWGVAGVSFSMNPWPHVAFASALLAAVVVLCCIGCKYAIRLQKMANEERKQRFEMRHFIFEKAIEYAGKQVNGGEKEDSKWSVSITVNKNSENDSQEECPPPQSTACKSEPVKNLYVPPTSSSESGLSSTNN